MVKDFANSISFLTIALDIILVLFSINIDCTLRGIFWFFIVPLMFICNVFCKNRIANFFLYLYESFLFICNILSLCLFTYESELVNFSVVYDDVFYNSSLNDDLYLMFMAFFQPIIISIIALIIAGMIKFIVKKSNSSLS